MKRFRNSEKAEPLNKRIPRSFKVAAPLAAGVVAVALLFSGEKKTEPNGRKGKEEIASVEGKGSYLAINDKRKNKWKRFLESMRKLRQLFEKHFSDADLSPVSENVVDQAACIVEANARFYDSTFVLAETMELAELAEMIGIDSSEFETEEFPRDAYLALRGCKSVGRIIEEIRERQDPESWEALKLLCRNTWEIAAGETEDDYKAFLEHGIENGEFPSDFIFDSEDSPLIAAADLAWEGNTEAFEALVDAFKKEEIAGMSVIFFGMRRPDQETYEDMIRRELVMDAVRTLGEDRFLGYEDIDHDMKWGDILETMEKGKGCELMEEMLSKYSPETREEHLERLTEEGLGIWWRISVRPRCNL